jgi:hypothetical protein
MARQAEGLASYFERLARVPAEDPGRLRPLGFADFRLLVEAVREDGSAERYGIVLDGYDVEVVVPVDDPARFDAEATLSGPVEAWREMLENVEANGGADRFHTLNALSIAEVPFRVSSPDPLGRDKFFRYAATLQELFDALATVPAATA